MSENNITNHSSQDVKGNAQKPRYLLPSPSSLLTILCSLLLALCSLSSCKNPLSPELLLPEMGAFSLSIQGRSASTIMPDLPDVEDMAFVLEFTGAAAVTQELDYAGLSSPINLPVGAYSLKITAYMAADTDMEKPVAQGEEDNIVIYSGTTTSRIVSLSLIADGNGDGTFKWELGFPSGLIRAEMTVTPFELEPDPLTPVVTELFVNLLGGAATGTGSEDLPSGFYNVEIELARENGQTTIWYSILHVYQNMESVLKFTFTDTHFNNIIRTVTFNYGDDITARQSVINGGTAIEPVPPYRPVYTFGGWYKEAALTNLWDFDVDTVTEDITLYAKWDCAHDWVFVSTVAYCTTQGADTYECSICSETEERPIPPLGHDHSGGSQFCLRPDCDHEVFLVTSEAELRMVGRGAANPAGYTDWTLGADYLLVVNITLSGTNNWTPIGTNVNRFTGTFDGGGLTITGLNVTIPSTTTAATNHQGMFGYIESGGAVKNLGLVDVVIRTNYTAANSHSYFSGIAGENSGTISNCFVSGSVTGAGTNNAAYGGITGRNNGTGIIENCYSTVNVSGSHYAGGIAGSNNGTVRNCVALGASVARNSGTNTDFGRVSGIVGTVENNYARTDMLYKDTPTAAGSVTFPGMAATAAGKDGESITSDEWQSEAWWRGIGFDAVNWPAARLPLELP